MRGGMAAAGKHDFFSRRHARSADSISSMYSSPLAMTIIDA
jgi:hypothetical protein